MKRSLVILCLAFTAGAAHCTPEIFAKFKETYAPKSSLADLRCMICHTNPPEWNAYGKAVKAALKSPVDASVFHSIESADSDGDGATNKEEIDAGTAPGDPASKPGSSAPAQSGKGGEGIIPRHGFHPLIVHFPIALFLFGAFLEIVGWQKKAEDVRKAGWWSILAGGLASIFAVGTGLLALFLNGYGFSGTPLIHFLLASSAVVTMLSTVVWRRKGPTEAKGYFALLILASILVGLAGHFGSILVYG